jgi:hypothetical protein
MEIATGGVDEDECRIVDASFNETDGASSAGTVIRDLQA